MAKLYAFNERDARALRTIARKNEDGSSTKSKTITTRRQGYAAYIVEPFEDIPAATTDSAGNIIVGAGDCWILERDRDTDAIDYRIGQNGMRVVVTVFNFCEETIEAVVTGGSSSSSSGSGGFPAVARPLVFATKDMFGDLYVTERCDPAAHAAWQGYLALDHLVSTAAYATVTITEQPNNNNNTAVFDSVSPAAGYTVRALHDGIYQFFVGYQLDIVTPPSVFTSLAKIHLESDGAVAVPKSGILHTWSMTCAAGIVTVGRSFDVDVISGASFRMRAAKGVPGDDYNIKGAAAAHQDGSHWGINYVGPRP